MIPYLNRAGIPFAPTPDCTMSEQAPVSQAPAPSSSEERRVGAIPPVLLKEEIKIFPDQRLSYLDQKDVKAYRAVGSDGLKAFAMVCEKSIVPQVELVHKYTGVNSAHLPRLVACGVVDWAHESVERFVFVYEDKLGKPISEGKNPNAMGLRPEPVISTIFRNLLDILRSMQIAGFVHGNIRVENIFDGTSNTLENAMLGETLSVPSGYAQPTLYQTIPRGLSLPLGRGASDASDDIYALGVTVACLLRQTDITEGLSDADIVAQKIDIGSFNFIAGKDRFPGAILEFLRGTLHDDPQLRWNFDDLLVWAEGRRVGAKQGGGIAALKASRPLEFGRTKFLRPQALATAITAEAANFLPLVENGELFLWLNRSLQDKDMEQRYDDALIEAQKSSGSSNYADRLASTMAIALAPEHAIFYKWMKFLPAGFGALLIEAVQTQKDLSPFVDVMQGPLLGFWNRFTKMQTTVSGDAVRKIQNCQRFMGQSLIGYGVERCIYYLCPMAPCYSEKLREYYVRSSEDYLKALEKLSASRNRPEWFLDRHIVAFLSVRDKGIIEPFLADIGSNEQHRQRQGILKVLALIQRRDKLPAMPGVSRWMAGLLNPLIERYHDREQRKRLREQLEKIKDSGSLDKMAALFDNYEELQQDLKNYSAAMKTYQALKKEYQMLESEIEHNKNFGMGTGRHFAMLVSGGIAVLVVFIYILVNISFGGGRVF